MCRELGYHQGLEVDKFSHVMVSYEHLHGGRNRLDIVSLSLKSIPMLIINHYIVDNVHIMITHIHRGGARHHMQGFLGITRMFT